MDDATSVSYRPPHPSLARRLTEPLKGIFDPRRGQWSEDSYVPSLIAAIGGILERHMIATSFLAALEILLHIHQAGVGAATLGRTMSGC